MKTACWASADRRDLIQIIAAREAKETGSVAPLTSGKPRAARSAAERRELD